MVVSFQCGNRASAAPASELLISTALLPYCPMPLLPYPALLPYCPTALLPYCPTALLPYSGTPYPTAWRFSSSVRKSAALTLAHSEFRSAASPSTWSGSYQSRMCSPNSGPSQAVSSFAVLADQRQHGQPVESAVGFAIIGVGVVAGNAEQHRRHAEGQRDVAAGRVLGLDEIHILRRQSHRLPVQPAFQQQRPAGPLGPGVTVLQFRLQPVELLVRQIVAVLRRINQRPEGRAELSSSALFQWPAALCVSSAISAASSGAKARNDRRAGETGPVAWLRPRRPPLRAEAQRDAPPLRSVRYSSATGQPPESVATCTRSGRSRWSSRAPSPTSSDSR